MFGHETNEQNCSIYTEIKFTPMNDEAVGINNGESVICVVTCMIVVRNSIDTLLRYRYLVLPLEE